MAELAVSRTYGSALFQAASEIGKVDEINDELHMLKEVFESEQELSLFFRVPSISMEEKKTTAREIFQGRISQEMMNFLEVLIEKKRIGYFSHIIAVYEELRNETEGIILGEIYSVVPLSEEQLAKFEEDTGRLLHGRVRLKNEIDKSLIGGVKIFAEGKIIDASVKSRVAALMERIVE